MTLEHKEEHREENRTHQSTHIGIRESAPAVVDLTMTNCAPIGAMSAVAPPAFFTNLELRYSTGGERSNQLFVRQEYEAAASLVR